MVHFALSFTKFFSLLSHVTTNLMFLQLINHNGGAILFLFSSILYINKKGIPCILFLCFLFFFLFYCFLWSIIWIVILNRTKFFLERINLSLVEKFLILSIWYSFYMIYVWIIYWNLESVEFIVWFFHWVEILYWLNCKFGESRN